MKIVSGGQTGIDRAALDVALKHGIECGGWCPTGRLDEFGRIPGQYPVRELQAGGFTERTLQNVKDSDGTVIIFSGELAGGTEKTVRFCVELPRLYKLIDACKFSTDDAAELISEFVQKHKINILNVAGPRQSEWAEGYDYASRALEAFISSITSKSRSESKRKIIHSGALLPDRGAQRNKRESTLRMNRSETR